MIVNIPGNARTCDRCGAVVLDVDRRLHLSWHRVQTEQVVREGRWMGWALFSACAGSLYLVLAVIVWLA